MKLAVPVSSGRVSTVFDFARRLLVVDYEGGREIERTEIALEEDLPLNRVRRLQSLGVRLLICGAVSRPLAEHLESAGVDVMPFVSGPVEEVLAAYLAGDLESSRFLMPGTTVEERTEWKKRKCPIGATTRL